MVLSEGIGELTDAQTTSSQCGWRDPPDATLWDYATHSPIVTRTQSGLPVTPGFMWDFTNSSAGQFTSSCKLSKI